MCEEHEIYFHAHIAYQIYIDTYYQIYIYIYTFTSNIALYCVIVFVQLTNIYYMYIQRFTDDKFLGFRQIQCGYPRAEDVSETISMSCYRSQSFLTEAQESSGICQILRLLLGT